MMSQERTSDRVLNQSIKCTIVIHYPLLVWLDLSENMKGAELLHVNLFLKHCYFSLFWPKKNRKMKKSSFRSQKLTVSKEK